MEPIAIPLKLKYRGYKDRGKRGKYRTRTGPRCCTPNCASNKKKSRKAVQKRAAK